MEGCLSTSPQLPPPPPPLSETRRPLQPWPPPSQVILLCVPALLLLRVHGGRVGKKVSLSSPPQSQEEDRGPADFSRTSTSTTAGVDLASGQSLNKPSEEEKGRRGGDTPREIPLSFSFPHIVAALLRKNMGEASNEVRICGVFFISLCFLVT